MAAGLGSTIRIDIDGPGASGKSTLASRLAGALPEAILVEGDDFYRPESDRRRSETEAAGLFDLSRLASQVLIPHSQGRDLLYQRYDWESGSLGDWVRRASGTPLIVEGVCATHRMLRNFYDMRIWVFAPYAVRPARGIERDGEAAHDKWVEVWIPAEDLYVANQAPQDHAHLVLDGSGVLVDQGDEVLFTVTGGLLVEKP